MNGEKEFKKTSAGPFTHTMNILMNVSVCSRKVVVVVVVVYTVYSV